MRIRVVLAVPLVAGVVALAVAHPTAVHDPDLHSAAARVAPPGEVLAVGILRGWDQRRARAWARGDVEALGGLYVPGSPAGRADVALLRRYLVRGLVVIGMQRQVLGMRVTRCTADAVTARVTDRVVGAVAVSTETRTPLPASAPQTRRLVLRRVAGEWRMASVRPAARP